MKQFLLWNDFIISTRCCEIHEWSLLSDILCVLVQHHVLQLNVLLWERINSLIQMQQMTLSFF